VTGYEDNQNTHPFVQWIERRPQQEAASLIGQSFNDMELQHLPFNSQLQTLYTTADL
jgi:hypothetical protein